MVSEAWGKGQGIVLQIRFDRMSVFFFARRNRKRCCWCCDSAFGWLRKRLWVNLFPDSRDSFVRLLDVVVVVVFVAVSSSRRYKRKQRKNRHWTEAYWTSAISNKGDEKRESRKLLLFLTGNQKEVTEKKEEKGEGKGLSSWREKDAHRDQRKYSKEVNPNSLRRRRRRGRK